MKFSDLKFVERDDTMYQSLYEVNGKKISVIAGEFAYSTPKDYLYDVKEYLNFEYAIFNEDGNFITRDFVDGIMDDVVGYATREEIESVIEKLENT